MRHLNDHVCLAAIAAVLVACPAIAQTTVNDESEAPLTTSSAGNISVTEDGSITVDTGAAVTVDSNNSITNEGSLSVDTGDGAVGIAIRPGTSTTIDNSGTISLLEDFVPADEDDNGIADGAIASASNRYGIYAGPDGTITGSIESSGNIKVEGLDSAGIQLDSALAGSFTNTGVIAVIGDRSYGIKLSDVTGDAFIGGNVTVTGDGSIALAATGDISGQLTIQGAVAQAVSYTNDDGGTTTLSRTDLRAGTPAVVVSGNVAEGVIVAVPPSDDDSNDSDEDDDGITDSEEGTGAITAYGNGPALLIGGTQDIVIGRLGGSTDGYSLAIDGTLSSNAYYTSTDSTALMIGGDGGRVDLEGGVVVGGTVSATTLDATATAILIETDAEVPRLYSSGNIAASISSPGEGAAYGIWDRSGTLTSIENTGYISVGGSSEDVRRAIDLSSNTTGVVITQYLNAEDTETKAEYEEDNDEDDPTVYTSISGDIVTGSGNDLLSASDGTIKGNTYFNAGDDQLILSGDAAYDGKVYFGTGTASAALSENATFTGSVDFAGLSGSLTIADAAEFRGKVTNGSAAAVVVNGGTFGSSTAEVTTIDSLTINASGALGVYIDGASGTSSKVVTNTATFAEGATVSATVSSLLGAEGSYTVLSADTLTGELTFDSAATDLPFIFTGSVTQANNDLVLDIRRKTADELGLKRGATQGYDAIITAAVEDDTMSQSFLDIRDGETLQTQLDQLLPDHAGGVFDAVTRGSRLTAQHVMDADSLFDISTTGGWLEPVVWRSSKDGSETVSYKARGWGISGGFERTTDIGNVGLSYAYLKSSVENNGGTGELDASQHELGAFWRVAKGPLYAFARISAARVALSSERNFTGTADDTEFSYANSAGWKGWLFSGAAGLSYSIAAGPNLTLRPKAVLDYYRLDEGGYTEEGGGSAMDLTVADRTSTALAATTTITASYAFGRKTRDGRPLTLELEGGRRSIVGGSLGTTRANFEDGEVFSIVPDDVQSGWLAEARLLAGGTDFTWKVVVGAEKTATNVNYSGRASLSVAF